MDEPRVIATPSKKSGRKPRRKYLGTRKILIDVLIDGLPHSTREFSKIIGSEAACEGLFRCWKLGLVLRTVDRQKLTDSRTAGPLGTIKHTTFHHLYLLKPENHDGNSLFVKGVEFVPFSKTGYRRKEGPYKSTIVRDFLKANKNRAWFTRDLRDALSDKGVTQGDVMTTARRLQRKGLVYIRGYSREDDNKPFQKGFLLACVDDSKPHEVALTEAIRLTTLALENSGQNIPLIQRVQRIRDIIQEAFELNEIVSVKKIQRLLNCTHHEIDGSVQRAMQLFSDIKEMKIFNQRYLYHSLMSQDKLNAAVEMKKNYIRLSQGKRNRIGHNFEAAVEWFMERFTSNAEFLSQQHRTTMDPRRITIHLLKPAGGRKTNNAEVDRIWKVRPSPFAEPITYLLECKEGLVFKDDVDNFLEVIKWSLDYGCDTADGGRQMKQNIIGILAASAFNPKENVKMRDGSAISLAQYAARLNIQLLKTSALNQKLQERGIDKYVTVQKVYRAARDEKDVRLLLDEIWSKPESAREVLSEAISRNSDVYSREEELEQKEIQEEPVVAAQQENSNKSSPSA